MNEYEKTAYAHWILEECNDPVSEIEWLVQCILNKNKSVFIQDTKDLIKTLKI